MVLAAVLTWYGCQKDNDPPQDNPALELRTPGDSKVFPPTAHPYGKSYAEWTILWNQVFMGFDCDHNPWLNPGHVLFYESGPVYLMAGIKPPNTSENVTVPHGKAILFPLTNYLNDYPCPDPSWQPAPGQTMEEFLTEFIVWFNSIVTDLSVTIDGSPVSNLESYAVISPLFYFTGHPSLVSCDPTFSDPCVTGEEQPAVNGGYYLMLKPLSKGTHTVHYHSLTDFPWGAFEQDGTFNITVE
jgi:hypothetical protein